MPLPLRFSRLLIFAAAGALALPAAGPAVAQRSVEGRVDKLEKEMQAVQRKVFPGGAGQIIAPETGPATTTTTPQVGSPATTPLSDLTLRVSAIESQLARLTGQVEQDGYRLRQIEEANTRMASQIKDLQAKLAAAAAPPVDAGLSPGGASAPAGTAAGAATRPATTTPVAQPSAATRARTEAVAAIERPSTGDAPQDSYIYGFRLWDAKFYPEAQTQLEETVAKYPNAPVASRAGNLLGRAYLDDGKPTQAAKVLFENYRARPKGDRAAESLAWTAEALIQLKRPKDACLAYDELRDSFGESMPANVKDMVAKGRSTAKCGA